VSTRGDFLGIEVGRPLHSLNIGARNRRAEVPVFTTVTSPVLETVASAGANPARQSSTSIGQMRDPEQLASSAAAFGSLVVHSSRIRPCVWPAPSGTKSAFGVGGMLSARSSRRSCVSAVRPAILAPGCPPRRHHRSSSSSTVPHADFGTKERMRRELSTYEGRSIVLAPVLSEDSSNRSA
jgi:hypothetical protein